MGKTSNRRQRLLDLLVQRAQNQLDQTLPQLIRSAALGLSSLEQPDEVTKLAELNALNEDLLDNLWGLGFLGNTPREGADALSTQRTQTLNGIQNKLYNSLTPCRNKMEQNLRSLWSFGTNPLDKLEEDLDQHDVDYCALLFRGGK